MSIFTKGICLLFINCNSSYAFCWGDKRKQLKPTLLLESLSAPWPWSLSLGCPVKGLAYRRPLINVYLMTRKETEKIFKTQIRSILLLICLFSISIDNWKLTAFNFRFINWYTIYFSPKISVVWVLIKLIYPINFQTFDSFFFLQACSIPPNTSNKSPLYSYWRGGSKA